MQGTGFFTQDSDEQGVSQHTTGAGGFLIGCDYDFNRWLAAEANYGYVRNALQDLTSSGSFVMLANVHEAIAAQPSAGIVFRF